jgi:hypothetical protein
MGSYPQVARSKTERGNGALLTHGLDKPSACPHSPTPTTTARPPPSTIDHPHIRHNNLAMTMVYARIADRTVADEYFKVSEKVEALYDQPKRLPAQDEGSEMAKLRREMNRRMLGNGYCARPVELDCHFESICESCTYFVTTPEFTPF